MAAPVLAGLGMSFVGFLRCQRKQQVILLESFAYGFGFAFAFGVALIRFSFTTDYSSR